MSKPKSPAVRKLKTEVRVEHLHEDGKKLLLTNSS